MFIPRPETERLVETAVELLTPAGRRLIAPKVVEVGCGTGTISVSLAAEVPAVEAWASDVNPRAVDLTRRNAHRHGVDARVHVAEGPLLRPIPASLQGQTDLLISNPPYVRREEIAELAIEVQHDPVEALDGGEDGLDIYRALASAAPRWLAPGGWIALEIGADQGESVPALLETSGLVDVRMTVDYNDLPRVVVGRKPETKD